MASVLRVRSPVEGLAGGRQMILHRVDRAVRIGERELRYQLARKDEHPLAQADELLDVLGMTAAEWSDVLGADVRGPADALAGLWSTAGPAIAA
jgi:hypothetical protein